jgi:sec-independent protein translocase protein TatC
MIDYDDRVSLVDHLTELRNRIIYSALAVVVGVLIAVVFNDRVFDLLLGPLTRAAKLGGLPESATRIITFSPAEPFLVSLKVWAYVGIMLASPVVIYEFWAFVGPAFAPTRRRQLIPIVAICVSLFLGGIAFGYLVVLPRGLAFLLGFDGDFFQVQNRAADYFSFAAWFLVAFGAVFELPLVLVILIKLEVIHTRTLRKNRRIAVVVLAVVAMVATPSQDAFSMLAMLIPLLVLYEISIIVGRVIERRRSPAAVAVAEEAGEQGGPQR